MKRELLKEFAVCFSRCIDSLSGSLSKEELGICAFVCAGERIFIPTMRKRLKKLNFSKE